MSWGMSRPGAGPPILSFLSLWGAPLPLEQPLVLGVMLWGWGALGLGCTALLTSQGVGGTPGIIFYFLLLRIKPFYKIMRHCGCWGEGEWRGGFLLPLCSAPALGGTWGGSCFLGNDEIQPQNPSKTVFPPNKKSPGGGEKGLYLQWGSEVRGWGSQPGLGVSGSVQCPGGSGVRRP